MNSSPRFRVLVLLAAITLPPSVQATPEAPATDDQTEKATPMACPLVVETDKQEYVVGENVRVKFSNTSDLPVLIELPAGASPNLFTVKRSDSTTLPFAPQGADACTIGNPVLIIVKPHASSDKVILLTHWYNISKPGTYTVTCDLLYHTDTKESPTTIGHSTSDEVTFHFRDWH